MWTLKSLSETKEIPTLFLQAYIMVLPKQGKDPTDCAGYRPIVLHNLDLRLFTKIWANRLCPILSHISGPEQSGFMPVRKVKHNIIKALNWIYYAPCIKAEGLLLSTDAEKAFDHFVWDFMMATWRHIGLDSTILVWIAALYKKPTANIKGKETFSEVMHIKNGTTQRCTLSRLLFILMLEPYIRIVNADLLIQVFSVCTRKHKVATYADGLLFFLNHLCTSIPNLILCFLLYMAMSIT